MKKITCPTPGLSGPFQLDNPSTFWWVNGTGYTADAALIGYCQRAGYSMEDGTPDADHLAAVNRIKTEAALTSHHTSVVQDAQAPTMPNYHSAA